MHGPAFVNGLTLLHDNKIDGGYETSESRHVVPVERLTLKEDVGYNSKDNER